MEHDQNVNPNLFPNSGVLQPGGLRVRKVSNNNRGYATAAAGPRQKQMVRGKSNGPGYRAPGPGAVKYM
jgi:hypothetical protein